MQVTPCTGQNASRFAVFTSMKNITTAREEGYWTLSNLAKKRATQRNVDPRLFGLLRRYGKRIYLQGDLHIFFGERMVPRTEGMAHDLRRIRMDQAIACDGTVKTVWERCSRADELSASPVGEDAVVSPDNQEAAGLDSLTMARPEQIHVFAYDIANDRRRLKAADTLLNYGDRVGFSVFECRIDPELAYEIFGQLHNLIDAGTDRISLYRVCGNCERSKSFAGKTL